MHNDIPAFPLSIEKDHFISLGMTLKEYYAGQALNGYLSNGASMDNAVHWSWQVAEKMMKKRAEKTT
jgi:hypothetical protein